MFPEQLEWYPAVNFSGKEDPDCNSDTLPYLYISSSGVCLPLLEVPTVNSKKRAFSKP